MRHAGLEPPDTVLLNLAKLHASGCSFLSGLTSTLTAFCTAHEGTGRLRFLVTVFSTWSLAVCWILTCLAFSATQ